METNYFKKCPSCNEIWSTQNEFITDELLEINGYKTDFEKLEYGLFFFTHKNNNCFSTMAIEVKDFMNLYKGTIYSEKKLRVKNARVIALTRINLIGVTFYVSVPLQEKLYK